MLISEKYREQQRPLKVHQYDPAIPGFAAAPQPCTFVACFVVARKLPWWARLLQRMAGLR